MNRSILVFISASLFALVGAGCFSLPDSPHTATTLQTTTAPTLIKPQRGFGILPKVSTSSHTGVVTIAAALPTLPSAVTVLRVKTGAPNTTELYNVGNSLGISDAFIGNVPSVEDLSMRWKDDRGYTWSYTGSSRTLEGKDLTAPTQPVTLATLPPNDALINVATTFLSSRGVDLTHNRNPLLAPDWLTWWEKARVAGFCMDRPTLSSVRFAAASAPTLIPRPPDLPSASAVSCVTPEFPTRVRVIYPSFIDDRDVLQADGTSVNAAELIVDASRMTVISAKVTPYVTPDRSDYPALSVASVQQLLAQGGITGVSGNVTLTSFDFADLQVVDASQATQPTYLYPSLVARGMRELSTSSTEPVTVIVPLVDTSS